MTGSRRRLRGIRFMESNRRWSARRSGLQATGFRLRADLAIRPFCFLKRSRLITWREDSIGRGKHMSTALITGASGGIGYEMEKLFPNDHYDLVLVARSSGKLAQFANELQRQFGISAKAIALDLSASSAPQFL